MITFPKLLPEDFALIGIFFAILTAVSRAAYILATERVGATIPGMGGYGDGQPCLHALGYPIPLLHHGQ